MTNLTLTDRFPMEEEELQRDLAALLLGDYDNELSSDEVQRLEEYRRAFNWDLDLSVECSFEPRTTCITGHYYPESLEEFLEFQDGEYTQDLRIDDLEGCSLEEFEDGEIVVEGKTLWVSNLRLKTQ